MKRKLLVAAMTLGTFIASFNSLWSQQRPLTHKVSKKTYSEAGAERIRLSFYEKAPLEISLPAFKAKKVYFARWKTPRVDAGHLWLALDRSTGAPFHDLLYLDTNCNQSLEDEVPLTAYEAHDTWSHFKPARIVFEEDPYSLQVSFYRYPEFEGFYATAASWHEGFVTLGEDKIFCRLIDSNSNGTFNDIDLKMETSDRIELGEQNRLKEFLMGRYLLVNKTYYRLEAAQDGSSVTFTHEEELPLGTLSVPGEVKEIGLYGAGGHLILEPKEGKVRVPAGEWHIISWRKELKDKNGSLWAATGKNRSMEHPITLTAEARSHVAVGEPLRSELEIQPRLSGIYKFNEKLKSGWGDQVEVEVNGKAPPPPRLLIKNEKETYGEVLNFTYG